ncbi:MAG: hypothetical protein JO317_05755 [Verrucomicrobiae bacterium]|nr:hypothetical protein [Verrucomicrobiae bacterium]
MSPTPRRFLQASALLFAASNSAFFFQFLFKSLVVRQVPQGDFSVLDSLLGVSSLVSLPVVIFTTIWVRKFAELRARGELGLIRALVGKLNIVCLAYAAIVCAVTILQARTLHQFLRFDNDLAVWGCVASLFISLAFPMFASLPQAMQGFGIIAAIAFFSPVCRLVFGWLMVRVFHMGVAGAVWASFFAALCSLVLSLYFYLRQSWPAVEGAASWRRQLNWKDVLAPTLSILVVSILMQTDLVAVRHFYAPADSDRFAIAAQFGHAVFFFITPVTLVLLPKVVDHFVGWEQAESRLTRKALGASLLLLAAMAIGGNLLAPLALRLFTGAAEPSQVALTRWFLWAVIPTSLAYVGLQALVARLQTRLLVLALVGSLLLPGYVALRHTALTDVLWAHFLSGTALLAVIGAGNLRRLRA